MVEREIACNGDVIAKPIDLIACCVERVQPHIAFVLVRIADATEKLVYDC